MRIVWDEPKRLSNLEKHAFDFADLRPGFFDGAAVVAARDGRRVAFGVQDGRVLAVVFQPLGREAVSVISMRPASIRERRLL